MSTEAATPSPVSEPILEVEKLRGLSKMLADGAIEKLTNEVTVKTEALEKYFWSKTEPQRHIEYSTFDGNRYVVVKPDPQNVGFFVIKLDILAVVKDIADRAVEINSSHRALKALKDFLARAEQVADEVDQIRSDVGEQ